MIRRHGRQIGSCWRKCSSGQQALLVLVHLLKRETFAELAAGFGISTATACRYVSEAVTLLAARTRKAARGLRAATKHAYVVLGGTLIPIGRLATGRPHFGKHRRHDMNLQVIAAQTVRILGVRRRA